MPPYSALSKPENTHGNQTLTDLSQYFTGRHSLTGTMTRNEIGTIGNNPGKKGGKVLQRLQQGRRMPQELPTPSMVWLRTSSHKENGVPLLCHMPDQGKSIKRTS